ncbi:MAG: hypothetical protein KGJ90_01960 [Patescibacteria group bacterium]|nr:hypothetical protein [Patescibacteria group bacterium]
MPVRAKFWVESKKEIRGDACGAGFVVELRPVCNGSDENKEFYKWTPAGSIVLETVNKDAADALEVGKSYYVDFIKAD